MFKIHKISFPKCFILMIVEYFFNCMVYVIFIKEIYLRNFLTISWRCEQTSKKLNGFIKQTAESSFIISLSFKY